MQRNLIDLSDDDPDPLDARTRSAPAQPLSRAPVTVVFDPFAHPHDAEVGPASSPASQRQLVTSLHQHPPDQHQQQAQRQYHQQQQQQQQQQQVPPTHPSHHTSLPDAPRHQPYNPTSHTIPHQLVLQPQQPCVGLHGSTLPRRPSHSPSPTPSALSPTTSTTPPVASHTSVPAARTGPNLVAAAAALRPASLDPLDAIIRQLPEDPLDSYLLTASPTAAHIRGDSAPDAAAARAFHLGGDSINDWDSLIAARTASAASGGPAAAAASAQAAAAPGQAAGHSGSWHWHGGLSWPSAAAAAGDTGGGGPRGDAAAAAGVNGWAAWPSDDPFGGAGTSGQARPSVSGTGHGTGTGLSPERERPGPTLVQRPSFSSLAATGASAWGHQHQPGAGAGAGGTGRAEGSGAGARRSTGGGGSGDGSWAGASLAAGARQRPSSAGGGGDRHSGASSSGGGGRGAFGPGEAAGTLNGFGGDGDGERGGAAAAAATAAAAVGDASTQPCRELLIYAIPLIKDKLVFLPVTAWQVQTVDSESAGVTSMVKTGLNSIAASVTRMWNGMKEKDPNTLQHKIYDAGQKIIENMTAEERLMRNIPAQASKLVVYHPTTIDPSEVQEQLSTMTANYCLKSVGKAAVAGLALPVAVGLEIIAVPGSGWYALYQLYKNSVSAAGGQRLKSYLSKGADVRVNYAAEPRLDTYVERVAISPDGALTSEDIDDLCHDLKEDSLLHPLTELRNRYIRKHVPHNSDYALLPVSGADGPHEAGGPDTPQGQGSVSSKVA